MVIGTDFDGLAREIEQRTGVPAFGFFTNGTQPYPAGVAAACIAVIDRFADEKPEKIAGSVNILGVTPLDMGRENLDALKAFVKNSGFALNCCCATDWTMDALKNIGAAQINLAPTQAGVEIARHLEEKFGTPWLAGLPVGERGSKELCERMRRCAEGEKVSALPEVRENADALAAGDWIMAASICRALRLDFGLKAAPVGLFGKTGIPGKRLHARRRGIHRGCGGERSPDRVRSADLCAGGAAPGAWKFPNTQCPAGSIGSGCSLIINLTCIRRSIHERKD